MSELREARAADPNSKEKIKEAQTMMAALKEYEDAAKQQEVNDMRERRNIQKFHPFMQWAGRHYS